MLLQITLSTKSTLTLLHQERVPSHSHTGWLHSVACVSKSSKCSDRKSLPRTRAPPPSLHHKSKGQNSPIRALDEKRIITPFLFAAFWHYAGFSEQGALQVSDFRRDFSGELKETRACYLTLPLTVNQPSHFPRVHSRLRPFQPVQCPIEKLL